MRTQIKDRLCVSWVEKATLAEIAPPSRSQALAEDAAANSDTILGWFRRLVVHKFDGSRFRRSVGRPRVDETVADLVVQMAQENPTWGYDRIVRALANVGHHLSDRTAGNILRRHGISPAPQGKQTTRWRDFIRAHMDVLVSTDFFTVEVLTLKELVTYYVLFFIHLETRGGVAGLTPYPEQQWREQQARNVTMKDWGFWLKAATSYMIGMASFVPRFAR